MPKEKEDDNKPRIIVSAVLLIFALYIMHYSIAVMKDIAYLDAGMRLAEFCTRHPESTWYGSLGPFDVKPVPCSDVWVQDYLVKYYPGAKYACEQIRIGNFTMEPTDILDARATSAFIVCLR